MTTNLHDILTERAGRVTATPDLDDVMDAVRDRSEHRTRNRRNLFAASGGALAVAGLVTGTLLLAPNDHKKADDTPAGGQPIGATTDKGGLVAIDPAPAPAPVSLGLVPTGWKYLGEAEAVTTYGVPGKASQDPSDWVNKIAAIVGTRYPGKFSLTIAGHPARINATNKETTIVVVAASKTVEVDIQVPAATHLTRAEIVKMANTLDIRDISHVAKG